MLQRMRWLGTVSACLMVVALACGTADAADRTKVDQATKRVEQGAKQIWQGQLGEGFKELFTGIGFTIVEGAKFSGNTMGEFFKSTFGS
jgi:hypothetical protein